MLNDGGAHDTTNTRKAPGDHSVWIVFHAALLEGARVNILGNKGGAGTSCYFEPIS
jgi:hypothetical protein